MRGKYSSIILPGLLYQSMNYVWEEQMLFPFETKGNAFNYYNKSWSKISVRFLVMIICLGFISFVAFSV